MICFAHLIMISLVPRLILRYNKIYRLQKI